MGVPELLGGGRLHRRDPLVGDAVDVAHGRHRSGGVPDRLGLGQLPLVIGLIAQGEVVDLAP